MNGPPPVESRPRLLAALFGAIALLIVTDLAEDLAAGIRPWHAFVEGAILLLSAFGLGLLARQLAETRRRARALGADVVSLTRDLEAARDVADRTTAAVEAHRAEAERWRREAEQQLRGLSEAIDAQLARWQLSPAEREIALLLLKGLTLKEIADLRATSERTVRQQTLSIYRKADVAGRAELSAFFLEDLLQPARPRAE